MNNTTGSVWQPVAVTATGLTTVTGNVFVAKTPEVFSYDLDGNMTSDGRWNYTWDTENRLIKVESRSDTPSSSWRRIEWTYDALGRRIQQVTSIWTNNAWFVVENLKFVSDPMLFGRHIVEINGTNNALVRSYVWGLDISGTMDGAGGVGGLLWVTLHTASGSASGTQFTCYDGNGNVISLVSATTGDVIARYEYGPFGEPIRVTGPAANQNPFRFSTKRTDNTIDLILYEYRVYSSSTGRWVSRDLINELGFKLLTGKDEAFELYEEKNLYALVRNRPVNYIDALGNGLCICVFKGHIGKLTVNSNCRDVLSMWVIDEYNAPAAGATAGTTVSADGFVIGGTTYKIDGSTCVEIDCAGGTVTVSCCVNSIALCLGKKCPYPVAAGSFGGPPKEPMAGSTPPVVK